MNLVYYTENNALKIKQGEIPKLKGNEILIKHSHIGLNFYDIDICRGLIKEKNNFIPGIEATGTIAAIGSKVKQNFNVGEAVTYCTSAKGGGYAQYNNIHEDLVISIPEYIENRMATGLTLRGIFAHTLLKRTFISGPGCYILLYNPTGALGHIICQLAKHLGCYVIGIASSLDNNINYCDLVLDFDDEDFDIKIMEFTKGQGVNTVYDTIGNNNLAKSISIMQYCGLYISLGQNSGTNLKVSMQRAMKKSIFITRPSIFDYKSLSHELRLTALDVFDLVKRRVLKPHINNIYKFKEINQAHKDYIDRKVKFINIIEL